MTIDEDSLAAFRFQVFYEDIIYPLATLDLPAGDDELNAFACGELREAVAMASLGVACGIYPPKLFSAMLNRKPIRARLDGHFEQTHYQEHLGEWPPHPVRDLPSRDDALTWCEAKVPGKTISAMPGVMDTYTSLMRQAHCNEFYRKFNAELLFAPDDVWREQFRALESATIPLITGAVDNPECIWLPEGLDFFYDFAEDLDIGVTTTASGEFAGFNISRDHVYPLTLDVTADWIAGDSLYPLVAWRFGGDTHADQVIQRVRVLQEQVSVIVAMAKFGPGDDVRRPGLTIGGIGFS